MTKAKSKKRKEYVFYWDWYLIYMPIYAIVVFCTWIAKKLHIPRIPRIRVKSIADELYK